MNGTSRPFFELTKPLPDLVGVPLRAVAETFESLGLRYFLVGAIARAIILENVFSRPAGRSTRDLDFGVALSNWDEFEALRAALIKTGNFEETSTVQQLLYRYSPEVKIKIDLIPFGGVEEADSSIAWPPKKDVVMTVAGFEEAFESPVLVRIANDFVLPVASLPGLIILKLFAWLDRKHERRDAPDILTILSEYVEAGNEERLFERDLALFEAADFDLLSAGALMLGKDARFVANQQTRAKLEELLNDNALMEQLLNQMVQAGGRSDETFAQRCESLLENFRKGFLDHA
jgi:predicted nucleotidyltransferase